MCVSTVPSVRHSTEAPVTPSRLRRDEHLLNEKVVMMMMCTIEAVYSFSNIKSVSRPQNERVVTGFVHSQLRTVALVPCSSCDPNRGRG